MSVALHLARAGVLMPGELAQARCPETATAVAQPSSASCAARYATPSPAAPSAPRVDTATDAGAPLSAARAYRMTKEAVGRQVIKQYDHLYNHPPTAGHVGLFLG